MELVDYLPEYPDISSKTFYQDIYEKKEFYDVARNYQTDGFKSHQKIIARFVSHWTLYQSLFIIHETGTGKSGVASAVFDGLIRERPKMRTLYLSNNDTLLENFRSEILKLSPYLQKEWAALTKKITIHSDNFSTYRNRILKEARIDFNTYARFSSLLQKDRMKYIRQYHNSLIILDEVHHLIVHEIEKGKTLDTDYNEIHAFLHGISEKKILLMSATPMRNSPTEIAPLINLILPLNQQFPIGQEFQEQYFTRQDNSVIPVLDWKPTWEKRFKNKIQGYVSVVKQDVQVEVEYRGKIISPMRHFPLYARFMSGHQTDGYLAAYKKDKQMIGKKKIDASFYSHSVQAALFVFPDGGYGIRHSKKYFGSNGMLNDVFFKETKLKRNARVPEDIEHNLQIIKGLSSTYHEILYHVLYHPHELCYVYCDKINGSGIWTCISLLTQCFHYSILKSGQSFNWNSPARRCIFLNDTGTGTTRANIPKLISIFNDYKNRFGDFVQVIFGTDKTREGITLKNIRQIHVASPDWNFGKIYQAIGRGIRYQSHKDLGPGVTVDIFFHCSIPERDFKGEPNLLTDTVGFVETEEGPEENVAQEEEAPPLEDVLVVEEDTQDDDDDQAAFKELEEFLLGGGGVPEAEPETVFPFTQLGRSVQYYKYLRSELRDYNIKQVEYALLTSAFDCQFNYNVNLKSKAIDYSAECMYKPCLYRCDGITNVDPQQLDQTTFNLFYTRDTLPVVIEMIQNHFSNKGIFTCSFDNLLDEASEKAFTAQQMVDALNIIISTPIPFLSRDGRFLFLTRNGDTFFLVDNRNILSWVDKKIWLSSYAKLPTFDTGLSFQETVSSLLFYQTPFESFFTRLIRDKDVSLYHLLPEKMKKDIILQILQGSENSWLEWVRDTVYKDQFIKNDEGVLIFKDKEKKKTFHIVDGELQEEQGGEIVVPAGQTEGMTNHDDPAFIEKFITNNTYKIYAFLQKGTFKIRDVSRDESDITDLKKKTRGRACSSYRISQLLYFAWRLGLRFPTVPPETPKKQQQLWEKINKATDQQLAKILANEAVWAEFVPYLKKEKPDVSTRRFFSYYVQTTRTTLCKLLEELFASAKLLVDAPIK